MEKFEYFPVIAVERTSEDCNVVCHVPNNAILKSGDLVVYSYPKDNSIQVKGVCVSNTLYLDRDTLDMICRIISTTPQAMPTVVGKITIDWYTNKEVSNE